MSAELTQLFTMIFNYYTHFISYGFNLFGTSWTIGDFWLGCWIFGLCVWFLLHLAGISSKLRFIGMLFGGGS